MHVQMGQLHVQAAAMQGIPRGLAPFPPPMMGPHVQITNGDDEYLYISILVKTSRLRSFLLPPGVQIV